MFHKVKVQFKDYYELNFLDWCSEMRKSNIRNTVFKYLMKKINPKFVKHCRIYGRYEVEKFSFGRQYFVTLYPNEYQYDFKLVDDTTKTVIGWVIDFELIDH